MTQGIKMGLILMLSIVGTSAATAGEVRKMRNADGLRITYNTDSERYCVRTSSAIQAEKLGLKLHSTECATTKGWARQGLTVARRSDTARAQVASVD